MLTYAHTGLKRRIEIVYIVVSKCRGTYGNALTDNSQRRLSDLEGG